MRRADRGMRVQRLGFLGLGELRDRLVSRFERVLALREQIDEARAPLEELRELVGAQLPR